MPLLKLRVLFGVWPLTVVMLAACGWLGGCGSNAPGRMEWISPMSTTPRVGTVYLIRGWSGRFSAGIDQMAEQLSAQGVTARVFMPEQYPEMAVAMVEAYKRAPRHEPICFIGHSRGCDASILIARELEKVGVSVEMIITLDSVDEPTVPKNVGVCYNYWMPGVFGDSNFLRGIPLTAEAGFTGKLFNYDLDTDYRAWRSDGTDHISMDDDPIIQKHIIGNILEVCVPRGQWKPPVLSDASGMDHFPVSPPTSQR